MDTSPKLIVHLQILPMHFNSYCITTYFFQKKNTYLEYMTTVGILLGGQNATTQRHMRGILEFEEKLARVT